MRRPILSMPPYCGAPVAVTVGVAVGVALAVGAVVCVVDGAVTVGVAAVWPQPVSREPAVNTKTNKKQIDLFIISSFLFGTHYHAILEKTRMIS